MNYIKMVIEIFDLLLFYWFVSAKKSNFNRILLYCSLLIIGFVEISLDLLVNNEILMLIKTYVFMGIIAFIVSKKVRICIAYPVMWLIIGIVSELLALYGISALTGIKPLEVQNSENASSMGIAFSRFILLILVIFIGNLFKKGKSKDLVLYIPFVVYSVGSLGVTSIMYYCTRNDTVVAPVVFVAVGILLIMNLLVLFFFEKQQERIYYKSELATVNNALSIQRKVYEGTKESYEKEKRILHDIKNYLIDLLYFAENKEWEKLEAAIIEKSENISINNTIKTGDEMIDFIINSKINKAHEKNIEITVNAMILQSVSVNSSDLAVLLGNAIDNAIENTPSGNANGIELEIICEKNTLRIIVRNEFEGVRLQNKKGVFNTIKTDGAHGYGLLSIQSIVDKHEGILQHSQESRHTF